MTPKKAVLDDAGPKRNAILDAALDLFAERGFHGTTMPEVAERAGVGAGTLYRYFEGKETLVNELFVHWKQEYATFLLADNKFMHRPFRVFFHEVWRRMGEFAQKYPKVVTFLELHHHGNYLDENSREAEMKLLRPLKDVVLAGQKQRVLRDLPAELLIALVYGAFTGLVRAAEQGFLTLSEETLVEAEHAIWEAIRA